MIICAFGISSILFIVYEKMAAEGIDITSLLFSLFLIIILIVLLIIFKDFKYLIVDKNNHSIKWFSLLNPLGKTIELKNYIGVIKSTEYGSIGEYRTAHLVDNFSMTSIKINGLFYTNFDELFDSIELKEIKNYTFGLRKYLQLIITGRIKIEK